MSIVFFHLTCVYFKETRAWDTRVQAVVDGSEDVAWIQRKQPMRSDQAVVLILSHYLAAGWTLLSHNINVLRDQGPNEDYYYDERLYLRSPIRVEKLDKLWDSV